MKKGELKKIVFIMAAFSFLIFVMLGVTLTGNIAVGLNITNGTVITKVNVINTEPNLYRVELTSPTPIDLSAGSTVFVNCTGYVYDSNGWDDVLNVSASIYHEGYGDGTTQDFNFRYLNTSCDNCTQITGSSTNASCSCYYNVWYYAYNGSWRCNMTVWDSYRLNDTLNSTGYQMNTVLGLDLPPQLDFGNLSVTDTSNTIPLNITNFGNVIVNVSVRGFGGEDESLPGVGDLAMVCSNPLSVNITSGNERYYVSDVPFTTMINISNSTTPVSNLTISVRTNDNAPQLGTDINQTFWRLYVPVGVTGTCNGTVIFYANDASLD